MSETCQRLAHSSWDCKYHAVFVPKPRRKVGAPMSAVLSRATLSVRNSPVRNDQAIEADLRRCELNSRETGAFRNGLKVCERVSVSGGRSRQHHHAEGSRGGRCNAIRIGNEFSNCGAAAWL